jgi:type I restriction enzyme S subunit
MADQTTTIPKGWKMTTLGEIISSGLVSNHNNKRVPLSSEERSNQKGEFPYYGAASAIDHINKYKYDGFYLLVAEDGTVFDGKAPMLQLVDGKFWVSNHSHVLQGKDEVITKFLSYVLKNVSIAPYITGAVQPKLTKENLYSIQFQLPEAEEEQRAIAAVLSSLDDKIELLREQNKTLEATAQAIFKEWFVNFNFAGATGKMIDSELGEIPEGWRVGRLGEMVEHRKIGINPANFKGMKFNHYSLPAFDKNRNSEIVSGEEILSNKYKILKSCFLVSKLNPRIPRIWMIMNPDLNSICSTEFQIIETKEEDFYSLVYSILNSDDFTKSLISKAKGTSSSHQRANPHDILDYEIQIPNDSFVKEYHGMIYPILLKIEDNNFQIQTLSTLRDTLLPKLMKGEVRVNGFND